jgi:hypothetical protein
LPATRQHAFVTALIERIDVEANRIDIHLRPTRLSTLLDIPARPLPSATDEAQILSVPIKLRRSGREITMLIDGAEPFATAKPDARLIKLLIRACRFGITLVDGDGVSFAELAKREGVSRSYFTRLVRLSYLAPDIIQAILDGRQPRDLTADKLLAHSRLPLTWHEQRRGCSASLDRLSQPALLGKICDRLRRHHRHYGTGIWPSRDIVAVSCWSARICRWPGRSNGRCSVFT